MITNTQGHATNPISIDDYESDDEVQVLNTVPTSIIQQPRGTCLTTNEEEEIEYFELNLNNEDQIDDESEPESDSEDDQAMEEPATEEELALQNEKSQKLILIREQKQKENEKRALRRLAYETVKLEEREERMIAADEYHDMLTNDTEYEPDVKYESDDEETTDLVEELVQPKEKKKKTVANTIIDEQECTDCPVDSADIRTWIRRLFREEGERRGIEIDIDFGGINAIIMMINEAGIDIFRNAGQFMEMLGIRGAMNVNHLSLAVKNTIGEQFLTEASVSDEAFARNSVDQVIIVDEHTEYDDILANETTGEDEVFGYNDDMDETRLHLPQLEEDMPNINPFITSPQVIKQSTKKEVIKKRRTPESSTEPRDESPKKKTRNTKPRIPFDCPMCHCTDASARRYINRGSHDEMCVCNACGVRWTRDQKLKCNE